MTSKKTTTNHLNILLITNPANAVAPTATAVAPPTTAKPIILSVIEFTYHYFIDGIPNLGLVFVLSTVSTP